MGQETKSAAAKGAASTGGRAQCRSAPSKRDALPGLPGTIKHCRAFYANSNLQECLCLVGHPACAARIQLVPEGAAATSVEPMEIPRACLWKPVAQSHDSETCDSQTELWR